MNRLRSELQMQAVVREKLRSDVSNARQVYTTTAEQINKFGGTEGNLRDGQRSAGAGKDRITETGIF